MSALAHLSDAAPAVWVVLALALVGLVVACAIEAHVRWADPDPHDPDKHEDPARLDSTGALDTTDPERTAA